MKKCIVVGAGDFNEIKIDYSETDYIIAADGGLKKIYDIGVIPDLIIGDMDSLYNKDLLDKFEQDEKIEIIKLPTAKDDTDTLAAIRVGLSKGYKSFELYGALGGRLDHTLANISCLDFLKENGANGIIVDDNKSVELLVNEERKYSADMYGTFSVFAFGESANGVTEKGFKYEIENATLKSSFPIGVSNEFIGKESSISVSNGKILIYIEKERDE